MPKNINLRSGEPWLIVTDLDGTFLSNNPNFAIPVKNIKAVKELNKLGHKFVLASGRSDHLMDFIHEHLELETPMISFHGALITDPSGKNPKFPLVETPVKREILVELLNTLDLFNKALSTHLIGRGKVIEVETKEELELLDYDVFEGVIVTNDSFTDIEREQIAKLIEDKFEDEITFKYLPGGSGVAHDLLLFVSKGTDKVNALKQLSEYYNIPQERIMYFGDNTNDINAIKYAGVGVVVESGKPHVKEFADYIAEGSNHDGAVGRFILKNL